MKLNIDILTSIVFFSVGSSIFSKPRYYVNIDTLCLKICCITMNQNNVWLHIWMYGGITNTYFLRLSWKPMVKIARPIFPGITLTNQHEFNIYKHARVRGSLYLIVENEEFLSLDDQIRCFSLFFDPIFSSQMKRSN